MMVKDASLDDSSSEETIWRAGASCRTAVTASPFSQPLAAILPIPFNRSPQPFLKGCAGCEPKEPFGPAGIQTTPGLTIGPVRIPHDAAPKPREPDDQVHQILNAYLHP